MEASNETGSVPFKSASWAKANRYEPGEELHNRATQFVKTVKWDLLAFRCAKLRGNIPCQFEEKYSVGHFNMVRHLVFQDGTSWIARLRMPSLDSEVRDSDVLESDQIIKVEVASMKFLRARTCIPVPTVHHWSLDKTNEIGAPYILMDYIDGTTANDLQDAKGCENESFGTPEQDRTFREQMASIQVELASLKFDKIGSLYQDEESLKFYIGPDLATRKGPWESSTSYYADLAENAMKECVSHGKRALQERPSFAIPVLFMHLMSLYGDPSSVKGPFGLANLDMGAHNLLVNDNFEIVGVIDFDGLMAAPIELIAQFPELTGLDREMPYVVETRPLALQRIDKVAPKLAEYQKMIEAAEATLASHDVQSQSDYQDRANRFGKLMLTDRTVILYGLLSYQSQQKSVNDQVMASYVAMLRKHFKSQDSQLSAGP
ncbi:MAG: hypothetical protein M4579_007262 [Chaenotheca gracillima]|nr:MAG: hypothetical protein M4579_007262 [Chaenotheca gracillima]